MPTFQTTLIGSGPATGIEVPDRVVAELDAGKRPPVTVRLNDHTFQSTVAVMGGRFLIAVNARARQQTGLGPGDTAVVELTLDTSPRTLSVPTDLSAALAAQAPAAVAFGKLTPSQRKRIVNAIIEAKTPETRTRRIEKAVADLSGRAVLTHEPNQAT